MEVGVKQAEKQRVPSRWIDGVASRDFRTLLEYADPQSVAFLVPRMSLGGLYLLYGLVKHAQSLRILLSAPGFPVSSYEKPHAGAATSVSSPPRYSLLTTTPAELILQNQLSQNAHAKALQTWLKHASVEIRSIEVPYSLPGMMAIRSDTEGMCLTLGNPELTDEGLAVHATMQEAGLVTTESDAAAGLMAVYEAWWAQGRDIKAEVLACLNLYRQENTPRFIYFLSLWHLFRDEVEAYRSALVDDKRLEETPIWRQLFAFQRHGAMATLRKLKEDGGCILADSVGLGKTYTALAVAKAYERMGKRVLVICPKKLRPNWEKFLSIHAPLKNECGEADFRYYILSHTDLRPHAKVNPGRVGKAIAIEEFLTLEMGLIIIDESHNFKNHTGKRYDFLLQHLEAHPETKLLLLSATPVNNRLAELTHQLALIHRIRLSDKVKDERGTTFKRRVDGVLRQSQKVVNAWNKQHADDRAALNAKSLLEALPISYFKLLERYTIARNRDSITRFYTNAVKEIGSFPAREILSHYPKVDTRGEQEDIATLSRLLEKLTLAAYNPLSRLKSGEAIKERSNLTDRTRQKALVALMRMNALKRLESSVDSFRRTIETTFKKRVDEQIEALARGQLMVPSITAEALEEEDAEEIKYSAKHCLVGTERFDVDALLDDICKDSVLIDEILKKAQDIDIARDAKLQYLQALLQEKVAHPLNQGNEKALIFTAFADTAEYLAHALHTLNPMRTIACVTGSKGIVFRAGECKTMAMGELLEHFAPLAQTGKPIDWEIDWLVATDCLSEGQNLQDCDFLVNYDIHWNPLRLNQRAGRIDRIGSKNKKIAIHNFWPMEKLDEYIGLERRIRTKDALAGTAGAGGSNLDDNIKVDLKYREQQLREMLDGHLESEMASVLTGRRDDFSTYLAELDAWLAEAPTREAQCLSAPCGLMSVTPNTLTDAFETLKISLPERGVLFLLKRSGLSSEERDTNPFGEYFLLAVDERGTPFPMEMPLSSEEVLALFRGLARDRDTVNESFTRAFHTSGEKVLRRAVNGALEALQIARERNRVRLLLGEVPFDYHSGQTGEEASLTLVSFLVFGDFSEVKHG